MLRSVTVGLDGSPESLAAADWAAREAQLRDTPLRLVHAWHWQPHTYASLAGTLRPSPTKGPHRDWAERLPRETSARLAERHPGLRVSAEQSTERPVTALLAASRDADLLVLGSRGLSGVTGFLAGSVALSVVARTERPVVLVRAGEDAETDHLTGDVVLGLDLENSDGPVIRFAFQAASRHAANLRVVHGWKPPPSSGYGDAFDIEPNAELGARVRRKLADVLRPWRSKFPGVEVTEQALIGTAGSHLVNASRNAALVVVGRRNRRTRAGNHIGPVTHAVLHHAAAPVAVIPHD
ncbi:MULTISPECIES: universal stress protein [unclassified Streptomyces]|uniref:universal stress protein n=1 Tax=unclassified Streptomyces TaxID=2593676 RepID=UPI002DD7A881|nr:universal stress protein [Streptomyces sp. NBC_01750]WSB01407.1 universal stress protein [Streptomyces sp. NBC_01794]WSD34246.1 universal stress protein [Streptomyces sp. NBC_01750]